MCWALGHEIGMCTALSWIGSHFMALGSVRKGQGIDIRLGLYGLE